MQRLHCNQILAAKIIHFCLELLLTKLPLLSQLNSKFDLNLQFTCCKYCRAILVEKFGGLQAGAINKSHLTPPTIHEDCVICYRYIQNCKIKEDRSLVSCLIWSKQTCQSFKDFFLPSHIFTLQSAFKHHTSRFWTQGNNYSI